MNKSSESYKVYLDKTPSAPAGVTSQKEVGGQNYPGRALPKAQTVETAKEDKGAAVRCAKQQTGENWKPINDYDYEKSSHGPNN